MENENTESKQESKEVLDVKTEIAKVFEEFKAQNDKGNIETTDNLNRAISDLTDEVTELKTAAARSQASDQINEKIDADVETKAHADAFRQYVLTGNLPEYKAAIHATDTPAAGGAIVPIDLQRSIVELVNELTPMRGVATVVSGSQKGYSEPVQTSGAESKWAGEKDVRVASESPEYSLFELTANELYAYPVATLESIEDSMFDLGAWFTRTVGTSFAENEEDKFINGTGAKTPEGLLTFVGATGFQGIQNLTGSSATEITGDELIDLQFALKPVARGTGSYLMNGQTLAAIRKLKTTSGEYLVSYGQQLDGNGVVPSVFGRPIVESFAMPIAATGNTVAVYGTLSDYFVYDRMGIAVINDEITQPGFRKMYTRKRLSAAVRTGQNMAAHTLA